MQLLKLNKNSLKIKSTRYKSKDNKLLTVAFSDVKFQYNIWI